MIHGKEITKNMDNNKIIADLESSGNFRVLCKLEKPDFYNRDDGVEKLQGCLIDFETTGLNPETDKIIETAIIQFEFSKDGRIFKVNNAYTGLEDPKTPLSPKIIKLTGLTDRKLSGESFDTQLINKIIDPIDIIISHNASFDRKFAEKRFPAFEKKSWGCSASQVNWENEGIASSKLEYLAYQFGFFYDGGHRAEIDAYATLHILSKTLPSSGDSVLGVLLQNATQESYRVWAVGSDYGKKDTLKSRGYKFFWEKKIWYIEIDKENLESELEYLKREIYKREINLPIDTITARDRFSARR